MVVLMDCYLPKWIVAAWTIATVPILFPLIHVRVVALCLTVAEARKEPLPPRMAPSLPVSRRSTCHYGRFPAPRMPPLWRKGHVVLAQVVFDLPQVGRTGVLSCLRSAGEGPCTPRHGVDRTFHLFFACVEPAVRDRCSDRTGRAYGGSACGGAVGSDGLGRLAVRDTASRARFHQFRNRTQSTGAANRAALKGQSFDAV